MVKETVAGLVAVVFALGATSAVYATSTQAPAPKAEEKKPADAKTEKKAEKKPAAKKEAKTDKAPAAAKTEKKDEKPAEAKK